MGSSRRQATCDWSTVHACLAVLLLSAASVAQCQIHPFPPIGLSEDFYDATCPDLRDIVTDNVTAAFKDDPRVAASLLRLHFHDCWPNGCDASVLLDATSDFKSEKDAPQNYESLRGFEMIDAIKAAVENDCPNTVSCADILTLAGLVAVKVAGGPPWPVALGRRDSTTSAFEAASDRLPRPDLDLDGLIQNFAMAGFTMEEMITLSGAHTFGRAKCLSLENRLYPTPELDIDPTFLQQLENNCPQNGDISILNDLDVTTPDKFDNNYYANLQQEEGLLHSDQVLFSTGGSANTDIVNLYANNQNVFFQHFLAAMIKMDDMSPLVGDQGEIRVNCHFVNSPASGKVATSKVDPVIALQ